MDGLSHKENQWIKWIEDSLTFTEIIRCRQLVYDDVWRAKMAKAGWV